MTRTETACPAAALTTQDNRDAWFAGYTPEYTAVVWVGNPDSNEPIPNVDGQAVPRPPRVLATGAPRS